MNISHQITHCLTMEDKRLEKQELKKRILSPRARLPLYFVAHDRTMKLIDNGTAINEAICSQFVGSLASKLLKATKQPTPNNYRN